MLIELKFRINKLRIYFALAILLAFSTLSAQKEEATYLKSIAKADSLFKLKQYASAANLYNKTFNIENRGKVIDRYNAAICWSLSEKPDSAFYQLNRIATLGNFANDEMLLSNANFEPLRNDKRWEDLVKKVKANKAANGKRLSEIRNIDGLQVNKR